MRAIDPSSTWQDAAIGLLAGAPTDATPHLDALAERDIDSLHYLANEPAAPAQRLYDKVWDARRRALESVLACCAELGVAPVVWKGAEMLARYYKPHALGVLGDIDLIVPRAELGSARHAVLRVGFRNTELTADGLWHPVHPLGEAERVRDAMALPHFRRAVAIDLDTAEHDAASRLLPPGSLSSDGSQVIVTIDLHHNLIESRFPIAPMIERAESSRFANARAFIAEDHLWLCCLRYYMEVAYSGKRSLRHFAYLTALLEAEELDWDEVVNCARKFRAAPALYYTLGFIARLRAHLVPDEVLEAVDPAGVDRSCDFGWQLGVLFDFIEPCPPWGWS